MKKFRFSLLVVTVLLFQAACLSGWGSPTVGDPNNLGSKSKLGAFENTRLAEFVPHGSEKYGEMEKINYYSIKEVKVSTGEKIDRVTISHFYQQMGDSAWNVSTMAIFLNARYFSLGLSVDRGDFTSAGDKLWTSGIAHRFGLEVGQAYQNNDSTYFGVKFAGMGYFPEVSFKMGYGWKVSQTIQACFEIQGICFGEQETYVSGALMFIKSFSTHHFSVKPYWSATQYSKLNLSLSEKFYIQKKRGCLGVDIATGYLPDDCVFIDYGRINKKRDRLSGGGQFILPGTQAMFCPACGIIYTEGNDKQMHLDWFVKLGLVVAL